MRQEERRHEVPVEKPLVRDECARQERNSDGCDGGLHYYSRSERFPAPLMHRGHNLQSSPRHFCQSMIPDHASTEHRKYNQLITAKHLFLEKNCSNIRAVEPTFSLAICNTSGDDLRPGLGKIGKFNKIMTNPICFPGSNISTDCNGFGSAPRTTYGI